MPQWKPPQQMRESWVDRQIREAEERGEFDDLPGKGKPLPDLDRPRDEMWWVKKLIRRENLSVTPQTLELRKERERVWEQALDARSEQEACRLVADFDAQVRAFNARPATGPPSNVMPIGEHAIAQAWRQRRS